MRLRPGLRVATVVLALLSVTCRTSGEVSEAAAERLGPQVNAVRQADAGGQADLARTELAELRALAQELTASGEVDETALERILAAAADVEAGLALVVTTTTAPTTTTTTEATRVEAPKPYDKDDEDKDDEDKDDRGGRGRGNGRPPGRGEQGVGEDGD